MESSGHIPVLLRQVVDLLEPQSAQTIVDCTVGLGGHAEALLTRSGPEAVLIAMDLDEANLVRARQRLAGQAQGRQVRFFHTSFADIRQVLAQAGVERADVLLADLGVASTQLDDPERGLSFAAEGPLDMRLDRSQGRPARELVNTLGERELADVLFHLADEHRSRAIARAIVAARREAPIETTTELAALVERAVGGRRGARIHPATRTFQALRIAVNDELGALETLLEALPDVLAVGGRAGIISFHSLEDRRVKRSFLALKSAGIGRIITPRPVVPDDEEMEANPRSRSAKLRCVERI